MKKLIISISVILFLAVLVSASVFVNYNFSYAIIEDDGTLTETQTQISDVNVIGFVCSSQNCANVSSTLWNGNVLNTLTNSITLEYPTILQSEYGYGVYFFKEGYIPFELTANWAGNGNVPGTYNVKLAKKQSCEIGLNNFQINQTNSTTKLTGKLISPINNAGALDYIPSQLEEHYSINALAKIYLNDELINEQQIKLKFSETKNFELEFNLTQQENNLEIILLSDDSKCVQNKQTNQSFTFQSNLSDTTPPQKITGLKLTSKGKTYLRWSWNNPSDEDFSHTIIYLNGVNVLNTSNNFVNLTGLSSNTLYKIDIQTVDFNGNINTNNVSDSQKTSSSGSGSGGGGSNLGGQNDYNYGTFVFGDEEKLPEKTIIRLYDSGTPTISTIVKTNTSILFWLIIFLLILIIILFILGIIYLSRN